MDRWFRIDALLLDNQADDGDGPHEELYQMLWLHPAVATFGMTSTTVGALRYLKERVVNTIFVNVRPVPHAVFWQELNEFLVKMHEEEPNVLIVFYAKKNEYESFLARHPSFEKYYFVPAEWVSPGEPNKIPSHEDFQKFDRWHRRKYSWDVCVSYASENKAVAEAIHKGLCARQTNVFFGDYERADLWGKKLDDDLPAIFKNKCRYCLIFLSAPYLQKTYTQLELEAALERIGNRVRKEDYLLVVKLDDSHVPLLPETTSFVECKSDDNVDEIVDYVNKKLWRSNANVGFRDFGRDADRKD